MADTYIPERARRTPEQLAAAGECMKHVVTNADSAQREAARQGCWWASLLLLSWRDPKGVESKLKTPLVKWFDADFAGNVSGTAEVGAGVVYIRAGMSEEGTVITAAHETYHAQVDRDEENAHQIHEAVRHAWKGRQVLTGSDRMQREGYGWKGEAKPGALLVWLSEKTGRVEVLFNDAISASTYPSWRASSL